MKIALYGGSFDPIHYAHLLLAEWIREELALNKIIFIPAFIPPHKQTQNISAAALRLEMIKLAIQDNPHFDVSAYEIEKADISYSINTILFYRNYYQLPAAQLFFLIGDDNLALFSSWKNPEKIVENCQVIVYRRNKVDRATTTTTFHTKMKFIQNPIIDISSSAIRDRIAAGLSIKYMVSPPVEAFILKNGLYKK